MAETRESLSEKIDTLEQKVLDTADTVTGTVEKGKDTVGNPVDGVKDTAGDAGETVRETLDLRLQTERHPWPMLCGAVAVGFIGGMLLPGRPKRFPISESHLGY